MTNEVNSTPQQRVLGLLLMRFKVSPTQSLEIVKEWLNSHPNCNWTNLENSLRNNLVRYDKNQLIDLYDETIIGLVNDMRGINGLEIKDRRYRLINYPQCFIGSEAVEWMQEKYGISPSQAVQLGEKLVAEKIIHHVTDDHTFKSDYLFYRFYLDEQE